jgi:hypothetical protein
MGLRSHIKRLERGAQNDLGSFMLSDGSRYFYDLDAAGSELFVYVINSLAFGEEGLEAPEILSMIKRARDPHAAIARFRPSNPDRAFVDIGVLLEDGPETGKDGF